MSNKLKIKNNRYLDLVKFEQWKIDSLHLSCVNRVPECEELVELTKDFLSNYPIKYKNCYDTAFQCAIQCQNVKFIIGYVTRGYNQITDHAWNKYNDIEFDLMQELNIHFDTYYRIVEISSSEISKCALSKRWLMDYAILEYYYEKHIATDEDYVSESKAPDVTVLDVIRKKFQEKQ